jgi:hypothetical protein
VSLAVAFSADDAPKASPPARKPSRRTSARSGQCGWCGWCGYVEEDLFTDALPKHRYKRVRAGVDGKAEEYDAGWCAGGGHMPEAVTR